MPDLFYDIKIADPFLTGGSLIIIKQRIDLMGSIPVQTGIRKWFFAENNDMKKMLLAPMLEQVNLTVISDLTLA